MKLVDLDCNSDVAQGLARSKTVEDMHAYKLAESIGRAMAVGHLPAIGERASAPDSLCSVEVPLVAHDFPFDEVFEFVWVRDHVLIALDLLVGLDDAEVDASQVDLARILLVVLAVADEGEVSAEELCRRLDAVLRARLVV